jgi:hypothetical protein
MFLLMYFQVWLEKGDLSLYMNEPTPATNQPSHMLQYRLLTKPAIVLLHQLMSLPQLQTNPSHSPPNNESKNIDESEFVIRNASNKS